MPLTPQTRAKILTELNKIEDSLTEMQQGLTKAFEDFHAEAVELLNVNSSEQVKLERAAKSQSVAEFEYRKPGESQFEVRVVRVEEIAEAHAPQASFHYITGWDYDRGDYRTFRLSRIRNGSVKVIG